MLLKNQEDIAAVRGDRADHLLALAQANRS
jgi:hypothetical protein